MYFYGALKTLLLSRELSMKIEWMNSQIAPYDLGQTIAYIKLDGKRIAWAS
jgi:hypothetical protein